MGYVEGMQNEVCYRMKKLYALCDLDPLVVYTYISQRVKIVLIDFSEISRTDFRWMEHIK